MDAVIGVDQAIHDRMDRTKSLGLPDMPEPLHGSSGSAVAGGRAGGEAGGGAGSRGGGGTVGRHRIENAQGSRLGGGGGGGGGSGLQSNSSDSGRLSPNDEKVVNEMRSAAKALTEGEADGGASSGSSEPKPNSNADDAFVDANFPASDSGGAITSGVRPPTRGSTRLGDGCRIDRVAAEREAVSGSFAGVECSVCGRSPVLSCCSQCEGLDGAPLVLCAIPDEPGGLSCFEQFHQHAPREGP